MKNISFHFYLCKQHYSFPRSTRLLDVVLHKDRGETIGPYIELLYELANHVDSFHSAGWIFRCLRAKNVWILESQVRYKKNTISCRSLNAFFQFSLYKLLYWIFIFLWDVYCVSSFRKDNNQLWYQSSVNTAR